MDLIIYPRKLCGEVNIIPSKSHAHRSLICAAFSDVSTQIICQTASQDIDATVRCLNALGADIQRTEKGYYVKPVSVVPDSAVLDCGESGSTLRFMLPLCASLGVNTVFQMHGRLPQRPLSPLWEELERMGCTLSRPTNDTIECRGQLHAGIYTIDGSVSSQFITGLMLALSLLPGNSQIQLTGNVESKPYIRLTEEVLSCFGVNCTAYQFNGRLKLNSPGTVYVEGDWSNAAFFLCANALGNNITLSGLQNDSVQGDRAVVSMLNQLTEYTTISGEDTPDLIPILSVVAGAVKGASFVNIGRLHIKESDRIASVAQMLTALGVPVLEGTDYLTIYPGHYHGCIIDAHNDHRIAMSAAIASTVSDGPVVILGAECVAKSYPNFWEEFINLGGYYEQYIR